MNKEERDLRGIVVSFNQPASVEELEMMIENNIFPLVIQGFQLSDDYLNGKRKKYIPLRGNNTNDEFYTLKLDNLDDIYAIIKEGEYNKLNFIVSTECDINNISEMATVIDKYETRYSISDYIDEVKKSIFTSRELN